MKNLLPLTLFFIVFFNSYSQTNSIIDQVTDCDTNCSDLTINFTQNSETTSYEVESIPYNPPTTFNGLVNQLFLNTDDLWSGVVNLPFDFNFFGANYNQLVIGTNGVLSFDVSNANTGNGWAFSESLPNNTNPTLSEGNIFGACHDIDPAASNGTHEFGWEVIGVAPFRAFVVSMFNVAHFSCNDLKTTQMIVLYETTNFVDVYIQDKPVCQTWNGGNAVIGVQNNAGTIAYVPPGRNTGVWTAQNEAWRFNPDGPANNNMYAWYDNNNVLLSNEATINVCPETTTNYTAVLEYYNVSTNDTETATETITIYVDIVLGTGNTLTACDYLNTDDGLAQFDLNEANSDILNGLDPNEFSITYYESLVDAESETNEISTDYFNVLPYQQTIYARVENINSGCFEITDLSLEVAYCPVSCGEPAYVTYCYSDNDTTEFVFSSEDGSPLTVIFNSGSLEVCCDEIQVFDDFTNNLLYSGNNGGDLTDLVINSTTGRIKVAIVSNGSVSCESGSDCCASPIDFDVYCSDSVGIIRVNAFLDNDEDTIFDNNESLFSHGVFTYEVNNNGVVNNVTSSTGTFIIPNFDENNTYDIGFALYEEYETCLNQTLNLVEDVNVLFGNTESVDFPITEISGCYDIGVFLSNAIPPRPGLVDRVNLFIENNSDITISGSVEVTYDNSLTLEGIYYVNNDDTVTTTASGFILDFNDLPANEQEIVQIRLNVPTTLNLGDVLTHTVVYNETDLDLSNNSFTLTEEVVNSYDPNDKAESHGGKILIDDFTESDYLFYTIRFQNLGNADALNIRIEDVLDSQLDVSTFKMLSASHEYTLTRIDNELVWQFSNVNLPPESEDEAGSNGFVLFKVKPNSGFAVGDIIPNTADIYFDFNPAITTNTFETEFVNNLSVTEFDSSQFSIYPNPTNNVLNVNLNGQIGSQLSVAIYDIQGKLISDELYKTDTINFQIDVSNLSTGLYVIKFYNDEFQEIKKLIIN
ncbi:T9SS type A sorting domain-containing protein [Hanstruepera ponticola]|uniref:T9SS type A sorting domain-containing protein n=1 Tax=Hanstruepera ponticola TaxID=2042995 RepID=UPI000CF1B7A7|nr:T9SS type A sorting domain-containing protein [Hanstruepera ponticola]